MRKIGYFLAALAVPALASAADATLLRMVMPDAKVVAGIRVSETKNSPFGQFLLSRMQVDDEGLRKFVSATGFDPRRDVSEIVIASNWQQTATPDNRWLVTARGSFDLDKIRQVAQDHGVTTVAHAGLEIYKYSAPQHDEVVNGLAFLDSRTAAMGDLDSLEKAIDRAKAGAAPSAKLLDKAGDLSAKNDFWFVSLVPISEFAGAIPNPNLSGAMKGNFLAGILEASGGVKFGDTVSIHAQTVARSEKDAQALVDVVKFIAGMVQLNRQQNATAGDVASLLDTLDCKADGTITTLSLAIPESQVEQLIAAAPHAAGKKKPVN